MKEKKNIKENILIQFWLNFLFTSEQISTDQTKKKRWQQEIRRWFT